jgi:hypothetical protein
MDTKHEKRKIPEIGVKDQVIPVSLSDGQNGIFAALPP